MSDLRPFDLQAHRGGAGLWPENTVEAFGRALALGVSTLELDVHLTAGDDVVVAHERRADPVRLNLEIKYDALAAGGLTDRAGFVAVVVDALRIDGLVERTSIQCFDWGVLRLVGAVEPRLARTLLVSPRYLGAGADGLITNRPDLLREVLAATGHWLPPAYPD